MKKITINLVLVLFCFAIVFNANAQKNVKKTFSAKAKFLISTVSGDCTIKKADDNQISVHLIYTYPDDCFEYKMDESADYLKITEEFNGNCKGKSEWHISVPENTEISFNTASGNFWISNAQKGLSANSASGNMKIKNVGSETKINTASGNLILQNIKGTLKITTASGNVKIESLDAKTKISTASGDISVHKLKNDLKVSVASGNVKIEESNGKLNINAASGNISVTKSTGAYHLTTASGNIKANLVEITTASKFSAASGNIDIILSKSLGQDLNLSTASGDVDLNYSGNAVAGYFEFTAREDKGKIVSPFKFDKEEVIKLNGKDYDKKSFTKGSSSPKVILKTASGTIKLVK